MTRQQRLAKWEYQAKGLAMSFTDLRAIREEIKTLRSDISRAIHDPCEDADDAEMCDRWLQKAYIQRDALKARRDELKRGAA